MSDTHIHQLTLDQQSLIQTYREKWREIALAIGPINRQKAAEAVGLAYSILKKKEPQLIFFESVYEALKNTNFKKLGRPIGRHFWDKIWSSQKLQVEHQLDSRLDYQLKKQLVESLDGHLGQQFVNPLVNQLAHQFDRSIINQLLDWIQPELWACEGCFLDFAVHVLQCHLDAKKWLVFQKIVQNCGWIFPCEKSVIICNRPIVLSFDVNHRLHAEGKPAIQFADGYSLYAYQGIQLPEKYGIVPPDQWRVSWISEEQNPEIRQVLLQGMGCKNGTH
jgi:hypothetical protein